MNNRVLFNNNATFYTASTSSITSIQPSHYRPYFYLNTVNQVSDLQVEQAALGPDLDLHEHTDVERIILKDGTVITVDRDGNPTITDKDARIIYKPNRIREFNRFINASDILEEFIAHAEKLGVTQSQFMALPIQLFINFLIIRAAEADGESPPPISAAPPVPRCRHCGRFIAARAAQAGLPYCDEQHMLLFVRRQNVFQPQLPRR